MRRLVAVGLCLAWPLLTGAFTGPAQEADLGPDRLLGIWSRFEPVTQGDPVRFYYFHPDGMGLFRYGRLGLTYTRMFRWTLDDRSLALEFMQTGARHRAEIEIRGDTLVLVNDPVMGSRERYRRRAVSSAGDGPPGAGGPHPFARMWTHHTKDRAGRQGFHIYQLQAPGIDGRGLGWFHEGDHTAWSTEALSYRAAGQVLDLRFGLRGEQAVTPVSIVDRGGGRVLELERDPRNYWHPRGYADGGPGFAAMVGRAPFPFALSGDAPVRSE